MSRPLALVDLDDTLFQTMRKCPETEHPHLRQCATASNDSHSFATRPQTALHEWLSATAEMVPVTARGSEAYSRVSLAFHHGAVLANGAVVLAPGGEVDPEWRETVRAGLAAALPEMESILARGRERAEHASLDLRSWLVTEDGVPCYAVFKDNIDPKGRGLVDLSDMLPAPPGWRLHRNGNNLAFIPPCISKRLACERLIEKARESDPGRLVIGIGDSLSDLDYMGLCDFWATPSTGQISDAIRPHSVHGAVARPLPRVA